MATDRPLLEEIADRPLGQITEADTSRIQDLFVRRKDLTDDLNFRLAKYAYRGFHQVEIDGFLGVPKSIINGLTISEKFAFYAGIELSKGRDVDMGSLDPRELVGKLVETGYIESGGKGRAANALLTLTNKQSTKTRISGRLQSVADEDLITFLHAYHSKRMYSQEESSQSDFTDRVYEKHHFTKGPNKGRCKDSKDARKDYVSEFIGLLKIKEEKGDEPGPEGYEGRLVPSRQDPDRRYFLQTITIQKQDGTTIRNKYCSCPAGFRKAYSMPRKGHGYCAHVKADNMEKAEQQRLFE